MAEDFATLWNKHVQQVEGGLLKVRRSSSISLMATFVNATASTVALIVHMDLQNKFSLTFKPVQKSLLSTNSVVLPLILKSSDQTVILDGVKFTFAQGGHEAYLEIVDGTEYFSKITLRLTQVELTPVYPKYRELHAALRNMSGREVDAEWDTFVGTSASTTSQIYEANGIAPDFYLELVYENRSMERDAVWLMTLIAPPKHVSPPVLETLFDTSPVQVTHSPFSVTRFGTPIIDPESGEMLAQWLSNDPQGAQWRFAVETVSLQFPPQAVGEAMERGARLWGAGQKPPIDDGAPVMQRFSRCTKLTVRPSRLTRRYTVHPGDLLSTLRDAQLESMTTEVGYPLEVTYARTERSNRTVVIAEVGGSLGKPTISLTPVGAKKKQNLGWLIDSLSDNLARWYAAQALKGLPLEDIYRALRIKHLANRASFSNRLAVFALKDAAYPDKPLNLIEDLSARLRSTHEGASPVFPLAVDQLPDGFDQEPWVKDFLGLPRNMADIRKLPIGLLYTLEFASELRAVLRTPVTSQVSVTDLSLSALGANGNVKASFDNGRTTFEVSSSNGQAWRIVKSRIGRIANVWNRARHVVVYGRSAVPSRQFLGEQKDALHQGRPLLRKLEEYIEILEPNRLFSTEGSAINNRCGCLHSFCFATQRIYVNSAWGRDLDDHSGYQIALYNPDDTSGFYVKPWLGPVALDANEELINHWHDHPQDVYFYSNTEKDMDCDPDVWPSVPGVDRKTEATFSVVVPDTLNAETLLGRKVVPDYTLAAAEDPRFSMRVTPQGQANIAHGRSDKALLASLRAVHIERTSATSRVDIMSETFKKLDLNNVADQLRNAVKQSAEARNIEAVITSLLKDAESLWKFIGVSDCETFKKRLKVQINRAFDEATGSAADIADTAGKLTTEVDVLVEAQIQQFEQWISQSLKGDTFKATVKDLVDQQLQSLRQMLKQLDPVDAGRLNILSSFFDREMAALDSFVMRLVEPLEGVSQTLNQYAGAISSGLAGQPLVNAVMQARVVIEGHLNEDPAQVRGAIEGWIVTTKQSLSAFEDLIGQITPRLDALQHQPKQVALSVLAMHMRQWVRDIEKSLRDATQALGEFEAAVKDLDVAEPLRDPYNRLFKATLEAFGNSASDLERAAKDIADPLSTVAVAVACFRRNLVKLTPCAWKSMKPIKKQLEIVQSSAASDIKQAVNQLDTLIGNLQDYCVGKSQPNFVNQYDTAFAPVTNTIGIATSQLKGRLHTFKAQAMTAISGGNQQVGIALTQKREALLKQVDEIDCTAVDAFQNFFKSMQASIEQTTQDLRDRLTSQAGSLLDEVTCHYAKVASEISKGILGAIGDASSALKSIKMLIEPPQIPHFSVNTRQIECVFDDIKTKIETSPFVARLHELEGGIRDLGMALPVQGFQDSLKMLQVEGNRFSDVIKQAGMDFETLLKKFKLPNLPEGAIRFSHQVDVQKRIASARVDVNHTFASTEQLFDIAGFSMDVRQPHLLVNSRVEASENQTITRTEARFGGDWIMNFGGQPLVTFRDANVQYSDSGGFKFDLDPKNVQPHPALLFITQVFQKKLPKLPEGLKVEKDADGQPIGVSMSQESTIGPYQLGGVSIGEATIKSAFAVRVVSGQMSVVSSFDLGTSKSPVFMQVGFYGGGGWLNARAGLEPKVGSNELQPSYHASMAVSLGSTRSFTLASVASGSYAVRLYLEATISSSGGNRFAAGLIVNGSARLLGYLNAYLSLSLEVEHSAGGMEGRGKIDIEIEICWCYSVRISRSVKQSI
jgi:hypothetical protein